VTAAHSELLDQQLIACPRCGRAAAVHIGYEGTEPVFVRVVCAGACTDDTRLRIAALELIFAETRAVA
jgi:hypothetical protein